VSAALARFLVEVQARDRVMLAVVEPPAILTGLDAEVATFFAEHPAASASEAARELGRRKQDVVAAARRIRKPQGTAWEPRKTASGPPGSASHG